MTSRSILRDLRASIETRTRVAPAPFGTEDDQNAEDAAAPAPAAAPAAAPPTPTTARSILRYLMASIEPRNRVAPAPPEPDYLSGDGDVTPSQAEPPPVHLGPTASWSTSAAGPTRSSDNLGPRKSLQDPPAGGYPLAPGGYPLAAGASTGAYPRALHRHATTCTSCTSETLSNLEHVTSEEYAELPPWEPPVGCPAPNGGFTRLRFSALTHYYLMAPLCVLAVASAVVYLGWKAVYIYSHIGSSGPTPVMFLTLEWVLFLSSFPLFLEISRPARDRQAKQIAPKGPFPFTNIFICCCKEPVDMIADTIKGAMHQVYPPNRYTVWVLDDGADDNLKAHVETEAAEKYGKYRLMYLRRDKKPGIPHHFKAGNINHGLNHVAGEFVAILDADMIPSPYFLTALLPHFTSEKIAFVQCPQSFYNIVRGDPLNDTSREFYDVLLPYRDGRDSAQCVGTGAIFRISALRQNGGFTVGTITEDFDTALSLHSQGFDSVYVNQKLQAGLAAWNLEAYVKQHQRWAIGSLQLLALRKPLRVKDKRFSLYRRACYWWAGVAYYVHVFALLAVLFPPIILGLDLPIMPPNSPAYVTRLYMILLNPYMWLIRGVGGLLAARFPHSDKIMIRAEQPWGWNSWFNIQAILKFYFPLVSKQFEATGAKKHVEKNVLQRLGFVWFHLMYVIVAVAVSAWRVATLDYSDCGRLLKVAGWTPAVLYAAQTMMVPVWHVLLSPWHPKPERRREFLNYSDDGAPYYTDEMVHAKKDWRMNFYHVLPTLWFAIMTFFFFAAVYDYAPAFCANGGFFGYPQF